MTTYQTLDARQERLPWIITAAVLLAAALDTLANYLAAHWLIAVWVFLIPGGTLVFSLAFTVYDFIRRQGGIWPTLLAIILGFVVSIAYSVAFGGGMGRIAVAGLIALACSSSTDLLLQTWTLRWPIWRYITASNTASLLVDTFVFTAIAFALLPFDVRVRIFEGQYLAKLAMMLLSIPLVYLVRRYSPPARWERQEGAA